MNTCAYPARPFLGLQELGPPHYYTANFSVMSELSSAE